MKTRSPLEAFAGPTGFARINGNGIGVAERRGFTKVMLAVRDREETASERVSERLGISLPHTPNSSCGTEPVILWTGVRRWMIVSKKAGAEDLIERLRETMASTTHLVTDCTDARVTVRLEGAKARNVIAKGCTLDLHPDVCKPGDCAQSIFAGVPVLLHYVEAPDRFDLYFDTSLARYTWRFLIDACTEYLEAPAGVTQ